MIEESCRKVYSPGKSLSLDESLVLFKGRLSFKQYINTKRARFGIKLYQLCTFNGILLDFIVYHGNLAQRLVRMEKSCLTTERIPVTLMQNYFEKGHHLFMDNFYTSLPLAKYFLEHGTCITGTIRDSRKHFPTKWKSLCLEKGSAAFNQHDGLVITKYRAKKDRSSGRPMIVHVLSTAHPPSMGRPEKEIKRECCPETNLHNFLQP